MEGERREDRASRRKTSMRLRLACTGLRCPFWHVYSLVTPGDGLPGSSYSPFRKLGATFPRGTHPRIQITPLLWDKSWRLLTFRASICSLGFCLIGLREWLGLQENVSRVFNTSIPEWPNCMALPKPCLSFPSHTVNKETVQVVDMRAWGWICLSLYSSVVFFCLFL